MAFVEYKKQWAGGNNPIHSGELSVGSAGSLGFAREDLEAVGIKERAAIYIDSDAHEIAFGPGDVWKLQEAAVSSFLQCKSGLKFLGWAAQRGRIPLVRENGRLVANLTELLKQEPADATAKCRRVRSAPVPA